MKKIFIDTNIFIRFLVDDNHKMRNETKKLFEYIKGGVVKAETDVIVLVEIIWVLSSFYRVKKDKIFEYLTLLLNLKNLVVKEEKIIVNALNIYLKNNVDFIDAFIASYGINKKIKYIYSYDKDYDKIFKDIKGISRIEPKNLT